MPSASTTPSMTTIQTDMPTFPDFMQAATLNQHIQQTLAFYHPRCIDTSGGFFHFFKDDGEIYDKHTRHLVSSTRFVFNYAMAYRHYGQAEYQQMVRHGVQFLRQAHRQPHGGYAWQIHWQDGVARVTDGDNHCYGLAFVVLAYAHAVMAGVSEARAYLDEAIHFMNLRFWQAEHQLFADQAAPDWSELYPYRGQNANMHACEALIAAFQATANRQYLWQAEAIARSINQQQAALAKGLIWEHYQANWQVDWDYNINDKTNIFRPWGYQPGHFTEWAKLLVLLERNREHLQHDAEWLLPRAEFLFQTALEHAWDQQHQGICYGFGPDFSICDGDKYFWVQAESFAAAALLARRTGKAEYWQWYQKIWEYSWQHMIDHQHGAWYRILTRDNQKISDEKSPAGKTDYHTMGACYDVLQVLAGGSYAN